MNDSLSMCIFDGFAHASEQLQALKNIERVLVAVMVDANAIDKLHHQEGQSVWCRAAINQPGNIGVIEPCEYLALSAKARGFAFTGQPELHDFDCNAPFKFSVRPDGLIDDTHPSFTHLPSQRITAQPLPKSCINRGEHGCTQDCGAL